MNKLVMANVVLEKISTDNIPHKNIKRKCAKEKTNGFSLRREETDLQTMQEGGTECRDSNQN